MEPIINNKTRIGRFTSSEIYKLIPYGTRKMTPEELSEHKQKFPKSQKKNCDAGFADGGLTYIKKKGQERKRKRSMSIDAYSRAIAWGNFMERRVFDLIGLEYQIMSNETNVHPKYHFWSGSKDLFVPGKKISDIKCYYPDKFCDYADCLLSKDLDRMRCDFSKEYWQIVSNAAINETPSGEAILYMPYDYEADEIKELVYGYDGDDIWKYRFISEAINEGRLWSLPFQPDDSEYPNLVKFEFDIPQSDIDFLTERVIEAEKLLLK